MSDADRLANEILDEVLGIAPAEHRTWLAESTRDGAWQAVCPDCPWCSRWVHFDEFTETDDPADHAADHAAALGRQHTAALSGITD